jgi:quinol monooxygenase YgiN
VVLVSVTRLRIRKPEMVSDFVAGAMASIEQAKRAAGCLRALLLRDEASTFWTMTLWTDESAMRDFVAHGDHRMAMTKVFDWCDEAAVVRWEQEGVEPADWMEAHARLLSDGRRSKVREPSDDHRSFLLRRPVVAVDRVMVAK